MHLHFKSVAAGLGLAAILGLAAMAQGQVLNNPQNTANFTFPNALPYAANQGLTFLSRNDPVVPATPIADHIQDVNQWFLFYRLDGGTNDSVGTLFLKFVGTADTNGDALPDQISATYGNSASPNPADSTLIITTTNTLIGSGTGTNPSYQSTVARSMSVRTSFASPTDVHLFSYTNLGLTQVESPINSGTYVQDEGPTFAQQIGRNIRVWQDNTTSQLMTDSRTDSEIGRAHV